MHGTAVGYNLAGDDLKQCGLSRSVTTNQTDPFVGFDGEIGIRQNGSITKVNG